VRLAVHTYAFRTLPLDEALTAVSRLGVFDVDLWLGHSETEPDDAAHALEKRHMSAVAISSGGFYSADSQHADRAFRLAERVGAPIVAATVAPSLAAWLNGTIPAGLSVAVENHWDQALARSIEIERAIEPHARLKACLDTGHALHAGERPERAIRRLRGRLAHVHLKDARLPRLRDRLLGRRLRRRILGRPEPSMPGDGALEVGAVRIALEQVGYDGAVALEYEGDWPEVALARLIDAWRRHEMPQSS
jgi:sugar phosphate isomerase/epimerase